ncbi:EAL domain-containing response regulator [Marinicella rhabdoformis]|uniref:EAL domain-containing response regulator n=1 Tax=Marinicella rhabdoformis TaxID=2580566 RepID=UPI0012AEDD95|nr:EAL domain-containing protein [Marinicella rhabdoformis]
MVSDKSINLLIIHQSEEEAERILSLLRNYQIAVRPTRCIDEEALLGILERKPIDIVLCQQLQNDLPVLTTIDHIKRMGKDIPVIALLENFDADLVQESIENGCNSYCTAKLPEHMKHCVHREMESLKQRRKNTELALELKHTEKRCDLLLDSSKQAIAYIHDGMHVYSNQSYHELFDYDDVEELEVTPFLNLIAKEDLQKAKTVLRDISKHILPDEDMEFLLKKADGETFSGIINFSNATINGEQCAQFIINIPSADPEVEKELFEIKNKDLLTKFFNRSYYHEYLSNAIDDAKTSRGDSLIMVEADDAEKIKKAHGIGNYDQFIVSLSEFLNNKLGNDVTYCRYAGSTFILQIKLPIEKAERVAEKLRAMVAEEIFSAGDTSINCTISLAVTQITKESETPNSIIKLLTQQIEKLTERGGNAIATFDPAEEEKLAKAASKAWIDRITDGLQNDKFKLHYQPVINIEGDEQEHYEVLVRLLSGEDLISPIQFIPVAEKYGFIKDIDRWVVKNAIQAIKSSNKDVELFVKLSHHTLTDTSFPQWLMEQFKTFGVGGDKLSFEIKESDLVTHAKTMKPIIKALKEIHCFIIVEKFGSGLNSFSILKHFPVDVLKVDSSLMEDLSNNEENQGKVKDLIEKAHTLGKQVICEQIEDANTMSIMWKMAVNYVQGNFIAPPGPNMEQSE